LLLAGCAAATISSHAPSATPTCFRAPGHREVAGELVDIPRGLPKRPPLLIAFHGLRETATQLSGQTAFDQLAAKHGFVVAYPNAVRAQHWQLNHHDGDEDVAHIRAFIDHAITHVCADPRRVYLTGFSNGAGFAARAGCELRDQVAAIAPVSGSYRSLDDCGAASMPTLEIHGQDPWTKTISHLLTDTKRRNGCTSRFRR
jgi:polyhydroxybutyrate depolymerase